MNNSKIQIVHIIKNYELYDKYCIYKKSFFREQLLLQIKIPIYNEFNKNISNYYWNSPLKVYKVYNNKNKKNLEDVINGYVLQYKWKTMEYFPDIFGSIFENVEKASIKFYDIKNFRKDFAEYFFKI